jgi:hypothetical protein
MEVRGHVDYQRTSRSSHQRSSRHSRSPQRSSGYEVAHQPKLYPRRQPGIEYQDVHSHQHPVLVPTPYPYLAPGTQQTCSYPVMYYQQQSDVLQAPVYQTVHSATNPQQDYSEAWAAWYTTQQRLKVSDKLELCFCITCNICRCFYVS